MKFVIALLILAVLFLACSVLAQSQVEPYGSSSSMCACDFSLLLLIVVCIGLGYAIGQNTERNKR